MKQNSIGDMENHAHYALHRARGLLIRLLLPWSILILIISGIPSAGQVLLPGESRFVSARAGELMDTDLPWWQELNIFSTSPMFNEWGRYVDVSGLGGLAETQQMRDFIYREMVRMHAQGSKDLGQFSVFNAGADAHSERPELTSAVVIDIYGNKVWFSNEWEDGWLMNSNHPVWQDFLLEQGRILVDMGMDGILIDEAPGTFLAIGQPGGSFGEPDMSMFRDYLSEHYTPQELLDQYGISNIETFDYGEYIHDLGLADTWITAPWDVPLWDDFYQFQLVRQWHIRIESIPRIWGQTTCKPQGLGVRR